MYRSRRTHYSSTTKREWESIFFLDPRIREKKTLRRCILSQEQTWFLYRDIQSKKKAKKIIRNIGTTQHKNILPLNFCQFSFYFFFHFFFKTPRRTRSGISAANHGPSCSCCQLWVCAHQRVTRTKTHWKKRERVNVHQVPMHVQFRNEGRYVTKADWNEWWGKSFLLCTFSMSFLQAPEAESRVQ